MYVCSTSTGVVIRKLTAHDANTQDHFGENVAISGKYAIVGCRYNDDDGNNSGCAYIFDVTTGVEHRKLLGDDTAAEDQFGCDVDICGNYAIVGAKGHNSDINTNMGAAYIFNVETGSLNLIYDSQEGGIKSRKTLSFFKSVKFDFAGTLKPLELELFSEFKNKIDSAAEVRTTVHKETV